MDVISPQIILHNTRKLILHLIRLKKKKQRKSDFFWNNSHAVREMLAKIYEDLSYFISHFIAPICLALSQSRKCWRNEEKMSNIIWLKCYFYGKLVPNETALKLWRDVEHFVIRLNNYLRWHRLISIINNVSMYFQNNLKNTVFVANFSTFTQELIRSKSPFTSHFPSLLRPKKEKSTIESLSFLVSPVL